MATTHREVTRIMQKLVASKSPEEKESLLWRLNEWGASRDRVEFSYTSDGLLKVECFNGTRARLPRAVTFCADLLVSNGSVVKSRMGKPRILSALERVAQSVDVV